MSKLTEQILTGTVAAPDLLYVVQNGQSRKMEFSTVLSIIMASVNDALSGKQNSSSELTTIASLAPVNNDIIQRKAGVWTVRTPAQFKVDLGLSNFDVGLGAVDNTSDLDKPVSNATLSALAQKQNISTSLTQLAALNPVNDSLIIRESGAWVAITLADIKTRLAFTKGDIGLGNVDNTSDLDKPISNAVVSALSGKQPLNTYLTQISNLTPAENAFMVYVAGSWINRSIADVKALLNYTKADVGLGNVQNIAPMDYPVSTAQETRIAGVELKADNAQSTANTALTTAQAAIPTSQKGQPNGVATLDALGKLTAEQKPTYTKADVGLGNVDNTSDLDKPISSAVQAALNDVAEIDAVTRGFLSQFASASVVSGGQLTLTGGTGFHVAAGTGFAVNAQGQLVEVSWTSKTGSTLFEGNNYIGIDVNGQLVVSSSTGLSEDIIGVGFVFTAQANTIVAGWSSYANSYLPQFQTALITFIQRTIGVVVESGISLSEQMAPNNLKVTLSQGIAWMRYQRRTIAETSTFAKYIYGTDYGWVPETFTPANTVSIGYYNDATKPAAQALVPMTPGYWKKDLFFCTPEGVLSYIYAQQQYATEQEARDAPIPPVPDAIKVGIVFVAAVVSNTNTTSIAGGIIDIRPYFNRLFERGANAQLGTAIDHGDLVGLDQDNHLQYHNDVRGDLRYYRKELADARYAPIDHAHSWTTISDKPTTLAGYGITDAQPLNTSLTQIAGLAPVADNILQYKSGTWVVRTPDQFKTDLALTKADVGLSNVDNTSDLDKPISTATALALAGKQASSLELTTIASLAPVNNDIIQRKAGSWVVRTPLQFKVDLALTKNDVGLSNVDNTSDLNKPISTATQAALDTKAPKEATYLVLSNDGTLTNERRLQLTANQLSLTDGGAGGNATLSIADNPIIPGTGRVHIPTGTTAQRPVTPGIGDVRYNTTDDEPEVFTSFGWRGMNKILQVVHGPLAIQTTTATYTPGTTAPTIANGAQVFSQVVTPKRGDSMLNIMFDAMVDSSNNGRWVTFMVFVDSTLVGTALGYITTAGRPVNMGFQKNFQLSSTNPVTVSIRAAVSGNTAYINQNNGSTITLGGSLATDVTIVEHV